MKAHVIVFFIDTLPKPDEPSLNHLALGYIQCTDSVQIVQNCSQSWHTLYRFSRYILYNN